MRECGYRDTLPIASFLLSLEADYMHSAEHAAFPHAFRLRKRYAILRFSRLRVVDGVA